MARKIILILCLTMATIMTSYSQTYTITEEELAQLEATLEAQQALLTQQQIELIELRKEIEASKTSLIKAETSFSEYEQGAIQIQERLTTDISLYRKKLTGWQIALPITALVATITTVLIAQSIKN